MRLVSLVLRFMAMVHGSTYIPGFRHVTQRAAAALDSLLIAFVVFDGHVKLVQSVYLRLLYAFISLNSAIRRGLVIERPSLDLWQACRIWFTFVAVLSTVGLRLRWANLFLFKFGDVGSLSRHNGWVAAHGLVIVLWSFLPFLSPWVSIAPWLQFGFRPLDLSRKRSRR